MFGLKEKKIFMIGIGGIGMSALSRLYKSYGISVSGYDDNKSDILSALNREGIMIYNLQDIDLNKFDVVIYTSDISKEHCLMQEAVKLNKPLIKRGEALSEIINNTDSIAVTGAHGKTTLTLLISLVLKTGGLEPYVYAGGIDLKSNSNFIEGKGNILVAEMDESDATFLSAKPHYTLITNIDHEHVTKYKTLNDVIEAFSTFIINLPLYSTLIVNGDDIILREICTKSFKGKNIIFCGKNNKLNDYKYSVKKINKTGMIFQISSLKEQYSFETSLIGEHHASNITLAYALFNELGINKNTIYSGIKDFKGVKRRLEKIYSNEYGGVWYSDYGHHPAEINAVITAMKNVNSDIRLNVIFEAHRFTRLQTFFDDFVKALKQANFVIISDIYTANEEGNALQMIEKLQKNIGHDKSIHINNNDIYTYMKQNLNDNSIVIIFSAGSLDYEIRKNIK